MEAILKREIITNKTVCRVLAVAGFVALITLGAFVRIPLPFTPVPLTLQTFFVLLAGAFLGSRLGVVTQVCYFVLGVSGLAYFFGPTGGYLLGFILAALVTGKLIKGRINFFSVFLVFCLADALLLASGTLWLKILFNLSIPKAIFLGFVPFIAGDIIKIFFATLIYLKLNARASQIF